MTEVKAEREDSPQPENAIPLMPMKTKPLVLMFNELWI